MKKHVILGNGGAAVSAICAIRSVSAADEIVVVSKEICYAYSPVLLTYYLSGRIKYDDIFIFNKTSYRKNNVKTILGKKAGRVNPARREVRLDDGSSI
ncbi:MAG: NAD(P)/FAD-dependent oxidoreductase, partial [Dehalococcoidia bacterium]|nr:NAD(P)/FAD-dependent oxidoreductase [Dehalococcoidia bacterium]